jgi:hypothetical protein
MYPDALESLLQETRALFEAKIPAGFQLQTVEYASAGPETLPENESTALLFVVARRQRNAFTNELMQRATAALAQVEIRPFQSRLPPAARMAGREALAQLDQPALRRYLAETFLREVVWGAYCLVRGYVFDQGSFEYPESVFSIMQIMEQAPASLYATGDLLGQVERPFEALAYAHWKSFRDETRPKEYLRCVAESRVLPVYPSQTNGCAIVHHDEINVVSFSSQNVRKEAGLGPISLAKFFSSEEMINTPFGLISKVFWQDAREAYPHVLTILQLSGRRKVELVGEGIGGPVAQIMALMLRRDFEVVRVVTFGACRGGDRTFQDFVGGLHHVRLYVADDPFVNQPLSSAPHVATEHWLLCAGESAWKTNKVFPTPSILRSFRNPTARDISLGDYAAGLLSHWKSNSDPDERPEAKRQRTSRTFCTLS